MSGSNGGGAILAGGVLVAVAVGLLVGTGDDDGQAPPVTAPAPTTTSTSSTVPPYDRDEFGAGWDDADGDGCDTRAEVLQRAMQREVVRDANGGGCLVLSGRLTDPYTGKTAVVGRRDVDVDHVVALRDAWQSGAFAWTDDEREAYANDPAVLVAADASVNRSKGDRGPDEWSPPAAKRVCWYVTTYEEIKVAYDLTITPAQQDAIDAGCPS